MRSPVDATPSWLWARALGGPGETVALDEEASHHLVRVCRARVGDVVSLTDGRGGHARAEVTHLRPGAIARVLECDQAPDQPSRCLACGAPEGERADWMVEKLAELGVTAFQPVDGARGGWRIGESRLERWRRLARAALGQSRSRYLMEVLPMVRLEAWLETTRGEATRWVGDPQGEDPSPVALDRSRTWFGLVGPAPGFEERERRMIEAGGFRPIRLAGNRLRTETAAVALAAVRSAMTAPGGG